MLGGLRTLPCAVGIALLVVAVGCGSTFTSASSEDGGGGGADGGASGGGSSDAGVTVDGTAGGFDGGVTHEGGAIEAGGGSGGVRCGPNTACAKSESCCVYDDNGSFNYVCLGGGACPSRSGGASVTQLQCANGADCGGIGHACCIQRQNGMTVSFCAGTCSSTQGQMCDPNAGITSCLATTCSSSNINQWGLPDQYGTCGGKGP